MYFGRPSSAEDWAARPSSSRPGCRCSNSATSTSTTGCCGARLLREAHRRGRQVLDRQRPARRGPAGPGRRRSPRPRGPRVKDARTIVGPEALSAFRRIRSSRPGRRSSTGPTTSASGRRFPRARSISQEFPGVELLRAVAAEISLPAFAIGGIDCGNVTEVRCAGFHRIAVSGAIAAADDPAAAA